jgi:hypothetical protein
MTLILLLDGWASPNPASQLAYIQCNSCENESLYMREEELLEDQVPGWITT